MRRLATNRVSLNVLVPLVLWLMSSPIPCFALELFVDDFLGNDSWDGLAREWDGTHGPRKTIQSVVDISTSGDIIIIADGIYTGRGNTNIDLDSKALTVELDNGPEQCVIDCEKSGRAFICDLIPQPGASIRGLTIRNGISEDDGGAIFCRTSVLTIQDCLIEECEAGVVGGAVCCRMESKLELVNCLLVNNTSDVKGGGIFCGNSDLTVSDCVFSENNS